MTTKPSAAAGAPGADRSKREPAGEQIPFRQHYRVNRGLLIATLVGGALLAGAAHVSRNYFLARNARIFLEHARQSEAAGELSKAAGYYTQYLQMIEIGGGRDPATDIARSEVLLKVGHLREQLDPAPQALPGIILLYEQATRLNPTDNAPRRRLIPLLIRIGRFNDALTHIGHIEASEPADAELAYRAGRCYESLNQLATAQQRYALSIGREAAQWGSYLGLARLWESKNSTLLLTLPVDSRDLAWPELQQLAETQAAGAPRPTLRAVAAALDRMVSARPGPEAQLIRAQHLSGLVLDDDMRPADRETASRRATEVLERADANGDGVLTDAETGHAAVPAWTDANHDATITRDELVARLELGDNAARLNEAERIFETLASQQSEPSPLLAEARLSLVGLLLTRSSSIDGFPAENRQALLERVRAIVRDSLQSWPDDPRFCLLASELELDRGNAVDDDDFGRRLESAERQLRSGLEQITKASPGRQEFDEWLRPWQAVDFRAIEGQLRFSLGEVLLARSTGSTDDAARLTEVSQLAARLRELRADPRLPQLLEFRLALRQNRRAAALELAKSLVNGVGTATPIARQVAATIGAVAVRFGNPSAALDIYRRQLKGDPRWAPGRAAVADVLTRLGRDDEAISEYQTVMGLPGVADRLASLVMIQQARRPAEQRDWRTAELALAVAERSEKSSLRPLVLRSELIGLKAVTLADLSASRGDAALRQQALQMLQQEESRLRDAAAEHPDSVEVWSALANTMLRRVDLAPGERRQRAHSILEKARRHVGRHAELATIELLLAMQEGKEAALPLVEQLARDTDELPEEGRSRFLSLLAAAFAQLGQPRSGREVLKREALKNLDDLEAQRRLLDALLGEIATKDDSWEADWIAALERVETLEGVANGTSALFRAQRLLLEPTDAEDRRVRLKTARELLVALSRSRPYMAAVPRMLGRLEEEAGNIDAAVESYERALALGDLSPALVTRMVDIYFRRQQYDDADRLLKRVANEQANSMTGDLARLAWRVAWRREQFDQAATIATQLAKQTQAAEDQVAAALLQFARGATGPEVLAALRHAAYELTPQSGQTWIALVVYLARTQDWNAAETAIRDAEVHLAKESSAVNAITMAQLWELVAGGGNPETDRFRATAAERYESALKQHPNDLRVRLQAADHFLRTGNLDRAESMITFLLDPGRAVPVEVRAWANRRRALLDAQTGTYDDTREALASLQRARSAQTDASAENLRIQLRLLQRLTEVDTLKEQRPLLLELESKDRLTPAEQLQLAAVLNSLGEWEASEARYQKLLQDQPDGLQGRLAYFNALLRRAVDHPEALDLAQKQLDELQRLEPRSWRTTAAQARLIAAQGQRPEAAVQVNKFIEARLALSKAERIRALLEDESPIEMFSALAATPLAMQQRPVNDALADAFRKLRNRNFVEAATGLADSPAAALFDDVLFDVVLQAARLVQSWDKTVAEALYRRTVTDSTSRQAPVNLAQFLAESGRPAEALAVCDEHWDRISPASAAFVLSLIALQGDATAVESLENWRSRVLAAADRLPPAERSNLFMFLGNVDNATGRYDSAIAQYRQAKEVEQNRFVPLNNFAFLSARTGRNLDEAKAAIEQALRIAGPRKELIDTRALVLLAEKKYVEARDTLQQQAVDTADPTLLFRLAECYYRMNEPDLARTILEIALKKGLTPQQLHPLDQEVLKELQRQKA